MRVEIGPVSGDSAVAWIRYGRYVLAHLRAAEASPLTAHVLTRFEGLLDEFDVIVRPGHSFSWAGEQSPEEVEFHMKGLYEIGLAVERENEAGRMDLRPPEADEFHVTMVRQILSEIEAEGPTSAQFVEGIRGEWGVAGND